MPNPTHTDVTATVRHCARCAGTHEHLTFRKFCNPIPLEDEAHITHWAMCPAAGEPILMRVESE